jgi:hypothetical protein
LKARILAKNIFKNEDDEPVDKLQEKKYAKNNLVYIVKVIEKRSLIRGWIRTKCHGSTNTVVSITI